MRSCRTTLELCWSLEMLSTYPKLSARRQHVAVRDVHGGSDAALAPSTVATCRCYCRVVTMRGCWTTLLLCWSVATMTGVETEMFTAVIDMQRMLSAEHDVASLIRSYVRKQHGHLAELSRCVPWIMSHFAGKNIEQKHVISKQQQQQQRPFNGL